MPKVYGAASVNCEMSNHSCGVGLLSAALLPLQLGRWLPPCASVVLVASEMPSGLPLNRLRCSS